MLNGERRVEYFKNSPEVDLNGSNLNSNVLRFKKH